MVSMTATWAYRLFLEKNGIERVIELDLNDEEKSLLESSRKAVKEVMGVLEKLG